MLFNSIYEDSISLTPKPERKITGKERKITGRKGKLLNKDANSKHKIGKPNSEI